MLGALQGILRPKTYIRSMRTSRKRTRKKMRFMQIRMNVGTVGLKVTTSAHKGLYVETDQIMIYLSIRQITS